jgi:hypothetical protein
MTRNSSSPSAASACSVSTVYEGPVRRSSRSGHREAAVAGDGEPHHLEAVGGRRQLGRGLVGGEPRPDEQDASRARAARGPRRPAANVRSGSG